MHYGGFAGGAAFLPAVSHGSCLLYPRPTRGGVAVQYTVTLDRRCRPRISAINTVAAFPVGPGGGQPAAADAAAAATTTDSGKPDATCSCNC